jgi:transposase
MEPSSKFARRYDAEFKTNAVALVESGRTVSEVARDLGCSIWSLGRWVETRRKGGGLGQPSTLAGETPEARELRRLRQENDYLRRQRDILKKALAIVSDTNLPGASNS